MPETPLQFRRVQSNGTVTSHIKLLLHWILARVTDYTPLLNLHVLPKPVLTIAQNGMFQACGVVNTAHIVLYDRSRKPRRVQADRLDCSGSSVTWSSPICFMRFRSRHLVVTEI